MHSLDVIQRMNKEEPEAVIMVGDRVRVASVYSFKKDEGIVVSKDITNKLYRVKIGDDIWNYYRSELTPLGSGKIGEEELGAVYRKGFKAGEAEGYAEGLTDGNEAGYIEGYCDGYNRKREDSSVEMEESAQRNTKLEAENKKLKEQLAMLREAINDTIEYIEDI